MTLKKFSAGIAAVLLTSGVISVAAPTAFAGSASISTDSSGQKICTINIDQNVLSPLLDKNVDALVNVLAKAKGSALLPSEKADVRASLTRILDPSDDADASSGSSAGGGSNVFRMSMYLELLQNVLDENTWLTSNQVSSIVAKTKSRPAAIGVSEAAFAFTGIMTIGFSLQYNDFSTYIDKDLVDTTVALWGAYIRENIAAAQDCLNKGGRTKSSSA